MTVANMLSQSVWTVAAAGAGLCFLGYCVYFDRKRRSDPFFRQKLREKRRKAKQSGKGKENSSFEIPDLKDTEAVQRFFLQEVQLGEELLATGDIENGVEHLGNAVAVCGQPQQLLQVLQQTLPAQVFQLLLMRLPIAGQRLSASAPAHIMAEDDLE
jgi:import receptor subunit TOM20